MRLNSNEIEQILPHRYPFLLVDRILDCTPGTSATGIKAVSVNEAHFLGHFPQKHVMPGVLIVESMAQVGAVAILTLDQYKDKLVYFTKIKNMKFTRQVTPGDLLVIDVKLIKLRHSIGIGEVVATVDGEVAASGELQFAIEK